MAQFDLRKSVNDNASTYFEKSKKLKNKLEGINTTLEKYQKELKKVKKQEEENLQIFEKEQNLKHRKKEWFEKFRWSITSSGKVCIGGRDSSSNESIIKKYVEKNDLIFHTDMAGSPFFILKLNEDDKIEEKDIFDVSSLTAIYSKAWKKGLSESDVFYVNKEQVTKEARAGESLASGSFVIKGKTNYTKHEMRLAIAVEENGRVNYGSVQAISNRFEKYAIIIQGDDKASDIAKKLKRFFKNGLLDEFVKAVPSGGSKIKEVVGNA